MASTNSVKVYGEVVEWLLEDASGVSEATSTLAWYSTSAPAVKSGAKPASTDTYWYVQTITFIPGSTQTTGSPAYVRLLERDASGPILFHADIDENAPFVVQSQTYTPARRCQPICFTSKSVGFATGAKWVFHLV